MRPSEAPADAGHHSPRGEFVLGDIGSLYGKEWDARQSRGVAATSDQGTDSGSALTARAESSAPLPTPSSSAPHALLSNRRRESQ